VGDGDHTVKLNGTSRAIATNRAKRKPVREYLSKQGRFAHFIDKDYELFPAPRRRAVDGLAILGRVLGVEAGHRST